MTETLNEKALAALGNSKSNQRQLDMDGCEVGVRVGLINYPRFPSDHETLKQRAQELADQLMSDLYQHSYSIVGPEETLWFSRRAA